MKLREKNILLWTLYDFANSIVTIVFTLYFSQWLVVDKKVPDIWYNLIFAVGSVLLLLTAPVLGAIADRTGKQQAYLNRITVLTFAFLVGASLTALFFSHQVLLAALFFLLGNYFYQFSFVFYNAMLHFIAPPEKWGTISGIGQAGNWSGQIIGVLIALPLATGAVYLVGEAGRAQAFLPTTILFFLLSLPMLLWLRLPKQTSHPTMLPQPSLYEEYRDQWKNFKELVKTPNMGRFLLSYFFFNDAIVTSSNNFAIFLQNVFSISDMTKSLLLVSILFTSVIGALCSGRVADSIGLKKALMIVLGSWIVIFPLLGITTNFSIFVVLCTFMGFLFGAIWTVTRAVMTALCPQKKLNFGFSYYTLSERVSTLVGPLSWGLITALLTGLGSLRYRIALIFMAVFVAIGFLLLQKIDIKQRQNQVS